MQKSRTKTSAIAGRISKGVLNQYFTIIRRDFTQSRDLWFPTGASRQQMLADRRAHLHLLSSSPYSLHHQEPLLTVSHQSINSICLLFFSWIRSPANLPLPTLRQAQWTAFCLSSSAGWFQDILKMQLLEIQVKEIRTLSKPSLVLVSSKENIYPKPKPKLFCSLWGLQSRARYLQVTWCV